MASVENTPDAVPKVVGLGGAVASQRTPVRSPRLTLVLSVVFACLSGIAYGYDLCVVGALMDSLEEHFELCGGSHEADKESCFKRDLIVTCLALGALMGRFFGGWLSDKIGRRSSLVIADLLICGGIFFGCIVGGPDVYTIFLLCRVLMGSGVGLALMVGPLYLSEIAPKELRGRFIACHEIAICLGAIAGFSVGEWSSSVSWQVLQAVGIIPGILQLALTLVLPESPRWLAATGKKQQLVLTLKRLDMDPGVSEEARGLVKQAERRQLNLGEKGVPSIREGFRNLRKHMRALVSSVVVATCAPASGIYILQSYAVDILATFLRASSSSEFASSDPVGDSSGEAELFAKRNLLPWIGVVKLLGAVIALFCIDRLGRRWMILTSAGLLGLCNSFSSLVLAGVRLPWMVSVSVFYGTVLAWNLGVGVVCLSIANEFFPTSCRSVGASVTLTLSAVVEIAYAHLFGLFFYTGFPSLPFLLFASWCLLTFFVAVYCIPETMQLSLESSSKAVDRMGGGVELKQSASGLGEETDEEAPRCVSPGASDSGPTLPATESKCGDAASASEIPSASKARTFSGRGEGNSPVSLSRRKSDFSKEGTGNSGGEKGRALEAGELLRDSSRPQSPVDRRKEKAGLE